MQFVSLPNYLKAPLLTRWVDRAMEYALCFMVFGVSISNALAGIGVGTVLLVWLVKKATSRFFLTEGLIMSLSVGRSKDLRKVQVFPKPLAVLSGVLFLAFAASLLNSKYLAQSLPALFLKYGKYLLLMFAIADGMKDKRVAIRLALVLCLVATVICWDGFYQFFSGRDLLLFREAGNLDVHRGAKSLHFFRVTATFPAANTFASYLVPVLMLGLGLSFFYGNKNQGWGWAKVLCLASMVLGLLMTFSRGGLIACLGGVLTLAFLGKKKVLLVIPLIFLVAFLFGKNLYGNRAAQDGVMDPTVQTRLGMLNDATQMFRSHPWMGIGLNTYYRTQEKNHVPGASLDYAHNSYIQLLAEVGILGFTSFLALMICWFGHGVKSFSGMQDPELKWLLGSVLAGVLGLCMASLFDNVLFELLPATLFWVLMGFGVALAKIGSQNNAS